MNIKELIERLRDPEGRDWGVAMEEAADAVVLAAAEIVRNSK